MHNHYICRVIGTGFEEDEYRPSIADVLDDARAVGGWATDIPSNPLTGAPLKLWCLVAVESEQAIHDILQAQSDIVVISVDNAARRKVRNFLRSQGERNPPDTSQGVLERLHPLDGDGAIPQISNLRSGGG